MHICEFYVGFLYNYTCFCELLKELLVYFVSEFTIFITSSQREFTKMLKELFVYLILWVYSDLLSLCLVKRKFYVEFYKSYANDLSKKQNELFVYLIVWVIKIWYHRACMRILRGIFSYLWMTFCKKLKELLMYFTVGHHLHFVTVNLIHWDVWTWIEWTDPYQRDLGTTFAWMVNSKQQVWAFPFYLSAIL